MKNFIEELKQKCLKITANLFFLLRNVSTDRHLLSTKMLSEVHSKH